ncbi:hypothetical protein FRZ03_09240 [Streptomyces misionensis]|uniref:Uncharacterized protein n=1 Tax=Streptomyces misionensis TaxID=67331 RepID=A0A5C6JWK3_9ACTN|nr:hypothetical protein FRZ03_09240 [Streptomyces misionensis]
MAMPKGHLNELLSMGEAAVGLKSGPITVTLPLNLPMRGARGVFTNRAPPRPALLTQARPKPSIWTANGWLRPPPVILIALAGSPCG